MRSLLAAALLAGCSNASEPFAVDLILRATEKPAYEFGDTVVRLTVVGANLCASPRGKLGDVDLLDLLVVEGDRVTLQAPLGPVMWTNTLPRDHAGDCTFLDAAALTLDCTGQVSPSGYPYREARASIAIPVQRTTTLDAQLVPSDVTTTRLTQFAAESATALDPGSISAFTIDGVAVAPMATRPREAGGGRIVIAPPEPLAPGRYTLRLAGGPAGIRGAAGECLSTAELTGVVEVRAEDPPRFEARITPLGDGRLSVEADDVAAPMYALERLRLPDDVDPVREAASPTPSFVATPSLGGCFRVVAATAGAPLVSGTTCGLQP